MTTPTTGVWAYRETTWTQGDLTGFKVEARDGDIGKIHEATNEVGRASIVVDTGPWIFGKKVLIPAGIIRDLLRADGHLSRADGPALPGGAVATPASRARDRRRGHRGRRADHGLRRGDAPRAPRVEARSSPARSVPRV